MPFEVYVRDDYFKGSDAPFISVYRTHITFNAQFTRQANLNIGMYTTIYLDAVERQIAFEFQSDESENSYILSSATSSKQQDKSSRLQCSAGALVNSYAWIKAVTTEPARNRRFLPKKLGNKWVIQLCPAFEERRARESADIPSVKGIYRYLRSGEMVYIGRGDIKKRLNSPDRADWDFDTIEFSPVSDPDKQVDWEYFWLEKYKGENNGKLPIYNRISGYNRS